MSWRKCVRLAPFALGASGCAWMMDLRCLQEDCSGGRDATSEGGKGGQGGAGGENPFGGEVCTSDQYFDEPMGCVPVTQCADDEFEKSAATSTSDAVCQKIHECVEGEEESVAPTRTSDRVCSICGEGKYDKSGACEPLTECTEDQYESAAPTATTDRSCEPLTVCMPGEEEVEPPAWNQDRVCVSSGCGNMVTEHATGEECDDGGRKGGDGCSKNCQIEHPDGAECESSEECISGACTTFYPDGDHDGYGDAAATSVTVCGVAFMGYATNDGDCCDSDPDAKPGQMEFFPKERKGCGGYDYDCDDEKEQKDTDVHSCVCGGNNDPGWIGAVPACGKGGRYGICVFTAGSGCSGTLGSSDLVQSCR